MSIRLDDLSFIIWNQIVEYLYIHEVAKISILNSRLFVLIRKDVDIVCHYLPWEEKLNCISKLENVFLQNNLLKSKTFNTQNILVIGECSSGKKSLIESIANLTFFPVNILIQL
jgi:hypothetical protein